METSPQADTKKICRPRGKTCTVCLEHVKNIYELREHMLLHNLHTCTKCLRYFKYKRSFENHRYFCQGTSAKNKGRNNESVGRKESRNAYKDAEITNECETDQEDSEEGNNNQLESVPSDATISEPTNLERDEFENARTFALHVPVITDQNEIPEAPVKRRRGRPPGSTSKQSRPTLVPVSGCTPISRKRSYRNLTSVNPPDLQMGIEPQTSMAITESKAPFYDLSMDVTCTTNTHSSCVVHSGNLNSTPGSSSSSNTCCHKPSQIFMPSPVVSPYQNTKESSFVWQGIQIQGEKPLVTRMEGINPVTEQQYVLYKCCLCGNAFPGIALLASHLMAHTRGTKEHSCQKCGAIFKWRSQLEVHEQVHQVMDSRLASPATSSCMMLMNSMGLIGSSENHANPSCHRLTPFQPTGTSNVSPGIFYPSSVSPIVAPDGSTLKESPNSSLVGSPSSPDNLVDTNFRKVAKANNQGGKSSFQCKFCPKSFDRLFSLQRHERIHTGIKPCFCKLCGKGFSERRNLRHHIIRFHSDGNQRELFRRNKGRPRPRNSNSSLKLVSFLKRTAVRILNSMDQSKFDSELNEDQLMQQDSSEANTSERNIKLAQQRGHKSEEPVMVVIPTDAPKDIGQTSRLSSNQGSDEEQHELLQDPKRSLIGNRRKGRPFRFANIQNNSLIDEERQLEALCNGKLTNFPLDAYIKEEPNIYLDGENAGLCTNMLQVTLTEDPITGINENNFPPETLSTFKAKLRGHGAFFSSYNPSTSRPKELKVYKTNTSRLGVVAKPVIRTEACKPQIGPDGKYVYPCSYCFKTFCSTSDLNRHMDFHEDVRPFKCPYCSYYSRTNSQLKVHMMRHQGIKHYLCHICNYNGVTQSDLNRHCKTRTHLLRTRNICSGCGLGFYTKSLLEEHEKMYNHSNRSESSPKVKQEAGRNEEDCDAECEDDDRNNNDCHFDSKNSKAEHSATE